MKKYPVVLIIPFMVFLAGCEATIYRTIYNSLDTIIYRSVAKYIGPDRDQERAIRGAIDSFLRWHRRVELGNYAVTLRGLETRMKAGLTDPDLAWLRGRFERHRTDLFNAVAKDTSEILASLRAEQIDLLDRRMGERLAEMEKAMGSPDRREESARSVTRAMEFIYGPLTARQAGEIARGVSMMEDIETERIRMFRERRSEFIDLLRAGRGSGAIRQYLARIALDPESSYPDYYREAAARRDRMAAEGFLLFDREMVTPEQRTHAVEKIRLLAGVLDGLRG